MKLTLMFAALLAVTGRAEAQPPQLPQRIVGDRISGEMQMDARRDTVIDTATLTFQNRDGGPVYTIDFIAHHPVQGPVASPGVVDIVVTQHPVEDDAPEMELRVDAGNGPGVTPLPSSRPA